MTANLEENIEAGNLKARGEIMARARRNVRVAKAKIDARLNAEDKRVEPEEKLLNKERELLKDLEKLMEISQTDAKELIDELESSGYGNYLERILKLPEFSEEDFDESIRDSGRGHEDPDSSPGLRLEHGVAETKIPLNQKNNVKNSKRSNKDKSLKKAKAKITGKTLHERGCEYIKAGMFENGLYYIDKALVIEPDNYEILASKGMALYWLNKPREALGYVNRALKINPDYAKGWNVKGLILKSSGQLNQAQKCFSSSLKYNPDYATGWFEKAQISQALGNFELAIKYYDKALELDPENAGANYLREVCRKILEHTRMMMLT